MPMHIGVEDGAETRGHVTLPQIQEKKYFSGKHNVIFGQLIFF